MGLIQYFAPPEMMWISVGDCKTRATRSASVQLLSFGIFVGTQCATTSNNSRDTAKPKLSCSLSTRLVLTFWVNRVDSEEFMATSPLFWRAGSPAFTPEFLAGVFFRHFTSLLPRSFHACL